MPPPPSMPSPSRRRRGPRPDARPASRPRDRSGSSRSLPIVLVGAIVALGIAGALATWSVIRHQPDRLLAEARAATEAREWPRALAAWHAWNTTGTPTAATWLVEAQLARDLNQGRAAAAIAERITRLDSTSAAAAAWVLRLNRLRVLDRSDEARGLGLSALGRLRTPDARRQVLKATTLATLAEVPDAEARAQLDRWIAADPDDIDAQVARMSRIAANPHPGDPDRATRIVELQRIVDHHPDQIAARETLTVALADSGEVDRGRATLVAWPAPNRDNRYDRLQARWDLEYDHQPTRAAEGFIRALAATPHDWKLHYGLARALRTLHQTDQAQTAALAVARLRERLDPTPLGARLAAGFTRLDEGSDPDAAGAMLDLAALCRSVGLTELADAWKREARRGPVSEPRILAPPAL